MQLVKLNPDLVSKIRSSVTVNSIPQCVSELILNSLDAKSKSIAIRVNPVTLRIQVVDNGEGITESNMRIVGARYTTNKVYDYKDLSRKAKLYGFRGEALASICAVTKLVNVTSRCRDSDATYTKSVFDNRSSDVIVSNCRPSYGTTITIEHFLHNVPVRKRLINSDSVMEEIKISIEKLQMLNPQVSFTLRNEATGDLILNLQKKKDVVDVFSYLHPKLSKEVKLLKISKDKLIVEGFIHKETYKNKKLQYIYVNKRPVVNEQLQNYLCSLLKTSSKTKTWPIFLINIQCPYNEVYLSPSSLEVNFTTWSAVKQCLDKFINCSKSPDNLIKDTKVELVKKSYKGQCNAWTINGAVCGKAFKRKLYTDNIEVEINDELEKRCKTDENTDKMKVITKGNDSLEDLHVEEYKGKNKKEFNIYNQCEDINNYENISKQAELGGYNVHWLKQFKEKLEKNKYAPKKLPRKKSAMMKRQDDSKENYSIYFTDTEDKHKIIKPNKTLFKNCLPIVVNPKNQNENNLSTYSKFTNNEVKGKNLIMDMFLKSTQVYSNSTQNYSIVCNPDCVETNLEPKDVVEYNEKGIQTSFKMPKQNYKSMEITMNKTVNIENYTFVVPKSVCDLKDAGLFSTNNESKCVCKKSEFMFNFTTKRHVPRMPIKYSKNNVTLTNINLSPIPKEGGPSLFNEWNNFLKDQYSIRKTDERCGVNYPESPYFVTNTRRLQYNENKNYSFYTFNNVMTTARCTKNEEPKAETQNKDHYQMGNKFQPLLFSTQKTDSLRFPFIQNHFDGTAPVLCTTRTVVNTFDFPECANQATNFSHREKESEVINLRKTLDPYDFHDKNKFTFLNDSINVLTREQLIEQKIEDKEKNHVDFIFNKRNDLVYQNSEPDLFTFESVPQPFNYKPDKPLNFLNNSLNIKVLEEDKENENKGCELDQQSHNLFPTSPNILNSVKSLKHEQDVAFNFPGGATHEDLNKGFIFLNNTVNPLTEDELINKCGGTPKKCDKPINLKNISDMCKNTQQNIKKPSKDNDSKFPVSKPFFSMKQRPNFLPKGLSPVLLTKNIEVETSMTQHSKMFFHNALFQNVDDLKLLKWENYLQYQDPKIFFQKLYEEKAKLFEDDIPTADAIPKSLRSANGKTFQKDVFKFLQVIGQIDKKFIAAIDTRDKLLIIFDQHAAHERLRLEYLEENYRGVKVECATTTIFIRQCEIKLLRDNQPFLDSVGLSMEFLTNCVIIKMIPLCVYNNSKNEHDLSILNKTVEILIQELIEILQERRNVTTVTPNIIKKIISMEACRGAVKFGDKLDAEFCKNLIVDLGNCKLPFQCAHGRPTLTPLIYIDTCNDLIN